MNHREPQNITLPAGDYYIGDPSAVIMGEDWRELCRQTRDFTGGPRFEFRGAPLVVVPVRSGDGVYRDDDEGAYIVESGLIGVIPRAISDADPFAPNRAAGRWEEVLQKLDISVYETQLVITVDGGHTVNINLEEE